MGWFAPKSRDVLILHPRSSGRLLSPDFVRLVPKKLYPDYYKVITKPIALDTVKNKLEQNSYTGLQEVKDDLMLIFKNAKTFNMKESGIYADARALQVSCGGTLGLTYNTDQIFSVFC